MIKSNEILKLFSAPKPTAAYDNLRTEIAAIRDGRKAISMFAFSRKEVPDAELYTRVLRAALKSGLWATHFNDAGEVCVFVHATDDSWRVPALLALRKILRDESFDWAERLEALQSRLLGYSEAQIRGWFDAKRLREVNTGGETLYFLFNATHVAALRHLGFRALTPEIVGDGIDAFYTLGPRFVTAAAAHEISGYFIARVAIRHSILTQLKSDSKSKRTKDIVHLRISPEDIEPLNLALRSNIEMLSKHGWS